MSKRTGTRYEHKARDILLRRGYHGVIRAAASEGVADLVAWDDIGTWYIQVKRCTTKGSLATAKSDAKREFIKAQFPRGDIVQLWVFWGKPVELRVWDWDGEALMEKEE